MSEFHTDALRPSSLPTASLGRRQFSTSNAKDSSTEDSELDKTAEEWNVRIDKEMKSMTGGLGELIDLADISITPNPDKSQINALHLKLKTSQLIRSAQAIRDIAHELKLMLLLSDQAEEVRERDKEAADASDEVKQRRKELGEKLGGMLAGEDKGVMKGDEEGMEVDIRPEQVTEGEGEGIDRNAIPTEDEEEEEEEDEGFEQVA